MGQVKKQLMSEEYDDMDIVELTVGEAMDKWELSKIATDDLIDELKDRGYEAVAV